MISGISHITFIVEDLDKATRFFQEIFGAKEVYYFLMVSAGRLRSLPLYALILSKIFIGASTFAFVLGRPAIHG